MVRKRNSPALLPENQDSANTLQTMFITNTYSLTSLLKAFLWSSKGFIGFILAYKPVLFPSEAT